MRCGRVSVRCPDVLSNGANIFAGGVLFVLLERRLDVSAEGRIIFQRHREKLSSRRERRRWGGG